MAWQKIGGMVLLGVILAAMAQADMIPFPEERRPGIKRSYIKMEVEQIPDGMVLVFLDGDNNFVVSAHQNESLSIDQSGTLYTAWGSLLPNPFSFKRDKKKLYKLKTIPFYAIPWRIGKTPPPRKTFKCKITRKKGDKFVLDWKRIE